MLEHNAKQHIDVKTHARGSSGRCPDVKALSIRLTWPLFGGVNLEPSVLMVPHWAPVVVGSMSVAREVHHVGVEGHRRTTRIVHLVADHDGVARGDLTHNERVLTASSEVVAVDRARGR
jgi:hypothetical protein